MNFLMPFSALRSPESYSPFHRSAIGSPQIGLIGSNEQIVLPLRFISRLLALLRRKAADEGGLIESVNGGNILKWHRTRAPLSLSPLLTTLTDHRCIFLRAPQIHFHPPRDNLTVQYVCRHRRVFQTTTSTTRYSCSRWSKSPYYNPTSV